MEESDVGQMCSELEEGPHVEKTDGPENRKDKKTYSSSAAFRGEPLSVSLFQPPEADMEPSEL